MLRVAVIVVLVIVALCVATLWLAGRGHFGDHEEPGVVGETPRSAERMARIGRAQARGATDAGVVKPKQILFGDLHVHTTFSFDAFMLSTPLLYGEGAHPPADACDFARHCSALDFWSINDHAEGLTPRHWRETVQSIRQCNEVAGDPGNPDLVSYLGWEWTQVGQTPEDHYGHKNVVLAHTEDERIPTRPISSGGLAARAQPGGQVFAIGALALFGGHPRYRDLSTYLAERRAVSLCPEGVPAPELPDDCRERAPSPDVLFRKLDEWGHDAIVIPHGTTWGFYTPPGSTWDKQLSPTMHDPARQNLIEVYSGHGNSEEYRDWRGVTLDTDGKPHCPEPTPDYLPSCWRAGEIIGERCRAEGTDAGECERRAAEARANAAEAWVAGHLTVSGEGAEEWLDAGQCRDCYTPAFNYRPGGSAQYVTALQSFADPERPLRFRFGFMASSDNHTARPGTGYKEVHRRAMTESNGAVNLSSPLIAQLQPPPEEPTAESRPFDLETTAMQGFQLLEAERQTSFFLTGGLIAVHSSGRDRGAIWDAMQQREVYGTSGPRILLWFDLLNAPGTRGNLTPMGSEVVMDQNPIFQVRAVGSFAQKPGCPEDSVSALGADKVDRLCMGECYHPSDRRRQITRIEVVRIQPRSRADEPIADLIRDPWLSLPCEPNPAGCIVTFTDPEYANAERDAVYYARAIEEPIPTINAANLRCEPGPGGACESVDLCGGVDAMQDDCLAEDEPRAWSSPIFVDYGS